MSGVGVVVATRRRASSNSFPMSWRGAAAAVTHDDIMSSLVEYNIDDVKRRQTQTLVNIFQGIEDVSFLDHCS